MFLKTLSSRRVLPRGTGLYLPRPRMSPGLRIADQLYASLLAIEVRLQIERPHLPRSVSDYFVGLRIVDHVVYFALACIGSYRIIQRASIKRANASCGVFESPE